MSIEICKHCGEPYDQDVNVEHEEVCEAEKVENNKPTLRELDKYIFELSYILRDNFAEVDQTMKKARSLVIKREKSKLTQREAEVREEILKKVEKGVEKKRRESQGGWEPDVVDYEDIIKFLQSLKQNTK